MAIFAAAAGVAADMMLAFRFPELAPLPSNIDEIVFDASHEVATVTRSDYFGAEEDLVVRYTGDGLTADDLNPDGGTFTELTIVIADVDSGTLSGITRPDNFKEIDETVNYHILDGDDTLTGDTQGDFLFAGFDGANDSFDGKGGDDTLLVSSRASAPTFDIEGGTGTDTLWVANNLYETGLEELDLRGSELNSIEKMTIDGSRAIINSSQLGSGLLATAVIGTNVAGTLVIHKDTPGTLDVSGMTVDPLYVTIETIGTADGETIRGTNGHDVIRAGAGADTVFGNGGDDRIYVTGAEAEFDTLRGGTGYDFLFEEGHGDIRLNGFNYADASIEDWDVSSILGNGGANTFNFTGGPVQVPKVDAGAGIDTIIGNNFTSWFLIKGAEGEFDTMQGNGGTDILEFKGTGPVTLNGFNAATQSIELVSAFDSKLLGNSGDNIFDFRGAAVGSISIESGSGNDTIKLGAIATGTQVNGGVGKDTVLGNADRDEIVIKGAEAEFDTMNGGGNFDRIVVRGDQRVTLDAFNASAQSLEAFIDNGHGVQGNAGANVLDFSALQGVGFQNLSTGLDLMGQEGNDLLSGTLTGDVLTGGLGADILTGNGDTNTKTTSTSDGDYFNFDSVAEIGKKKGLRDIITDFSFAEKIDLSTIDANGAKKGDKAFKFLKKEGADLTKAGQVGFDQKKAMTLVYGDTNGDRKADFTLELTGRVDLDKDHFVL